MAVGADKAGWSTVEQWAWDRICAGDIADFSVQGALDPAAPDGWGPERGLNAAFLRAILFDKKLSEAVPVEGIRIAGALWTEPLELRYAKLNWPLSLEKCRFEAPVDLSGLRIEGRLSVAESAFHGGDEESPGLRLDMASGQWVDLRGAYFPHGAAAVDAIFTGALDLSGASIEGKLDLSRATARSIRLREGNFAGILLSNCAVDQDLDLSGASVAGPLKMNDAQIGQDLWLGGSKKRAGCFVGEIDVTGARVGGILSMCGMTAHAHVAMQGLEVRRNVFLRAPTEGDDERETGETVFVAGISLCFALIHGSLDLDGVQIGEVPRTDRPEAPGDAGNRMLDLNSAFIEGIVALRGAHCQLEVSFLGARISGSIEFDGSQFHGKLNLADVRVDGSVRFYASDKVQARCLAKLELTNARIGGAVALGLECVGPCAGTGLHAGSLFARSGPFESPFTPVFKQHLDLSHATIDGICDLDDARVEAGIGLSHAKIGQDLRISCLFAAPAAPTAAGGTEPPQPVVDLSASTIEGTLLLALPLAGREAGRDHHLDLRDARVGSLQVAGPAPHARWPEPGSVHLDGLVFDRLRPTGVAKGKELAPWLKRWLALDKPFSPQPYEQVVSVLRQVGQAEEANKILYEARERVRRESRPRDRTLRGLSRWLGLGLLKITIGYGIGLGFFWALLWAGLLTAIGVAILLAHPPLADSPVKLDDGVDLLAYSFDQLLPIIDLSKSFGEVRLAHEAQQYFYVLRIFGVMLGAFITAGIAGLTQRSRS